MEVSVRGCNDDSQDTRTAIARHRNFLVRVKHQQPSCDSEAQIASSVHASSSDWYTTFVCAGLRLLSCTHFVPS